MSAQFRISENRTRCFLGMDLQSTLGDRTTQIRPVSCPVVVAQVVHNVVSEFWQVYYKKKFLFERSSLGKPNNYQVFSSFKSPLIPFQEKERRAPVRIQKSELAFVTQPMKDQMHKKKQEPDAILGVTIRLSGPNHHFENCRRCIVLFIRL